MAVWLAVHPLSWAVRLIWAASFPWSTLALFNITVDDTLLEYYPHNAWQVNLGCQDCKAHPDALLAFNETWHENVIPDSGSAVVPTVLFSFEGSAVYVACIVPDARATVDGSTGMRFALDGAPVGSYAPNTSTSSDPFKYNTVVYANASLAPGFHSLEIMNGVQGSSGSIILIDYIVYTRDTPVTTIVPASNPTSSITLASATVSLAPGPTQRASTLSTPRSVLFFAVIFSILGGLTLIAVLAWGIIFYRRRQLRQMRRRAAPSTQFMRELEASDAPRAGGTGLLAGGVAPSGDVQEESGLAGTSRVDESGSASSSQAGAMSITAAEAGPSSGIQEVPR